VDTRGVLKLTKHHGAGNDFLVLLDVDGRRTLTAPEARALCDRRRGVGADGLIQGIVDREARELTMVLLNADGTQAEMSGNGIRCLVQAATDAGFVDPGWVVVHTRGGRREVEYRPAGAPGLGYARVGMGPARVGPAVALESDPVPWQRAPATRWCERVDMGNPHVVVFGGPVGDDVVRDLGEVLSASFADGANVEFVWPGPDGGELTLRVWERGVGETLACGTGTCAAAAAAHAHGEVGIEVRVHNPGGLLDVELDAAGGAPAGIVLAGPTQTVGTVAVDEAVLSALVDAQATRGSGAASTVGFVRDRTAVASPTEVATRS
jgi:diaminopimelate epimerase